MNVIKGYISSLLGLGIMIGTFLYFFGFVQLPHPDAMPKDIQIGVSFGIGLALFLVPSTYIEKKIEQYIEKKLK